MSRNDASSVVVYHTNGIDGSMLSSNKPASSSAITIYEYVLEYLNEGGANFVFKILPLSNEHDGSTSQTVDLVDSSELIQGKLLRLRKDLSHSLSTVDQYNAYNNTFDPIFPDEYLVHLDLIRLSPELPGVINNALSLLASRSAHRQHEMLPLEEDFGLLVTDMTPVADDVLLQIKPKWLVQSPNAPRMSRRCRTCALRAQRASRQIRTATDAQDNCPLNLVSEDISIRQRAVECVTRDEQLREYLAINAWPLLQRLRDYQQKLDQHGVLSAAAQKSETVLDLCKAMTIRDCTLFLKKTGSTGKIEARLADLDLKRPEKLGRWREVESSLIDDGWYTNAEDSKVWRDERVCFLAQPGTLSQASK